jgi:hypothetical protein
MGTSSTDDDPYDSNNSGHGRVVPANPLFHDSVRTFMTRNPLYTPKAVYVPGTERYVP